MDVEFLTMNHKKQTRVEFTRKLGISKKELIRIIENLYGQACLPCYVEIDGEPSDKLTKVVVHTKEIKSQDLLNHINAIDTNKKKKPGYSNESAQNIQTKPRYLPVEYIVEGRKIYTDKRINKQKLAAEINKKFPHIAINDIGFEGDKGKLLYILSTGKNYEHNGIKEIIENHISGEQCHKPCMKIYTREQLPVGFLDLLEIRFPGYHFLSGGDFSQFGKEKYIEVMGANPPVDQIESYISELAAVPGMPQAQTVVRKGAPKMGTNENKVAAFDGFLGEMIKEAAPKVTDIVSKEVSGKIEPVVKQLTDEVKTIGKTISETTLKKEVQSIQASASNTEKKIADLESKNKDLEKKIEELQKQGENNKLEIIKTIKSMTVTLTYPNKE